MKAPRISILSIMTVALVVAIDCVALRSIGARPDFLTGRIWWPALASVPMVHALALGLAMLAGGRGPGRPFLVGFQVAGWAALAGTLTWLEPLLDLAESACVRLGVIAWIGESATRNAIVVDGLIPSALFLMQAALASIGGLLAWRFRPRREPGTVVDRPSGARRLAPLALAAFVVAMPAVAIEANLRTKVDPALERLAAGSLAVVDFGVIPDFPVRPPATSPLAALGGARVRVDADAGPYQLEKCMSPNGVEHIRDHRVVEVIMLDADHAGQAARVPRCVLRVSP